MFITLVLSLFTARPDTFLNHSRTHMTPFQVITERKKNLSILGLKAFDMTTARPHIRHLCKSEDIVCFDQQWTLPNKLHTLDILLDEMDIFSRARKHCNPDSYNMKIGQGGVGILWKRNQIGVSPMIEISCDRI